MSRLEMIGSIRNRIEELYDHGRFEFVREIMGEISRFNFSGVPDKEIRRIYLELHK